MADSTVIKTVGLIKKFSRTNRAIDGINLDVNMEFFATRRIESAIL